MSKADLKAAMESLNVKKPLRLHSPSPTFKAPLSNVITEQTQLDKPTQVDVATQAPAHTMGDGPTQVIPQTTVDMETVVSTSTQDAGQTMVHETTMITAPTSVASVTQVPIATLAAERTPVPAQTNNVVSEEVLRSASDQDSSVTLEANAAPKLSHGYTRLPNSILMRMTGGDLMRSEMQILLLIARFTISFQRRFAPLSKAVLERQTGLRGPAVLQAISNLLSKGLIEKIPGDQHRPNQLGLVFSDDWEFFPKEKVVTTSVPAETPVVTAAPVSGGNGASVAVPTPAMVPVATHFKDRETIENKNSLSLLPEEIWKYFTGLKPAKKRESEWVAFSGLKQDFSEGEIAQALQFLTENGTPGNGKPCHSPMAYLSMAMGEVIAVSQSQKEHKNRLAQTRSYLDAQAQIAESKAIEEEKDLRARNEAFRIAFPAEQDQFEIVSKFSARFPMLDPKGSVVRNLAMEAWWSEQGVKAVTKGI